MTIKPLTADDAYKDFLKGCSTPVNDYVEFWKKTLQHFGLTIVHVDNYPYCSYIRMIDKPCEHYDAQLAPFSYRGIWLIGPEFRKKCMTENGLKKFLKDMRIGVFNS